MAELGKRAPAIGGRAEGYGARNSVRQDPWCMSGAGQAGIGHTDLIEN